MRKIAKFTALTSAALASSNLAYAQPMTADNTGLRIFGGIGAGLVTPSMQYSEFQPSTVALSRGSNSNDSTGKGAMLLSGGMRYYFDRWLIGAIVEFNPIENKYYEHGASSTTAQAYEQINNNNFFDLGGQIGFRATPKTTFLVSFLGAAGSFTLNDRVSSSATGALVNNNSSTRYLAGIGFGLGANYRFEQHFLMELDYRYASYNTAGNANLGFRQTDSAGAGGTATFKPTQSMIDLSLVAEF